MRLCSVLVAWPSTAQRTARSILGAGRLQAEPYIDNARFHGYNAARFCGSHKTKCTAVKSKDSKAPTLVKIGDSVDKEVLDALATTSLGTEKADAADTGLHLFVLAMLPYITATILTCTEMMLRFVIAIVTDVHDRFATRFSSCSGRFRFLSPYALATACPVLT